MDAPSTPPNLTQRYLKFQKQNCAWVRDMLVHPCDVFVVFFCILVLYRDLSIDQPNLEEGGCQGSPRSTVASSPSPRLLTECFWRAPSCVSFRPGCATTRQHHIIPIRAPSQDTSTQASHRPQLTQTDTQHVIHTLIVHVMVIEQPSYAAQLIRGRVSVTSMSHTHKRPCSTKRSEAMASSHSHT
jgi:hypothetical protein